MARFKPYRLLGLSRVVARPVPLQTVAHSFHFRQITADKVARDRRAERFCRLDEIDGRNFVMMPEEFPNHMLSEPAGVP
jgi:hypothetical protein